MVKLKLYQKMGSFVNVVELRVQIFLFSIKDCLQNVKSISRYSRDTIIKYLILALFFGKQSLKEVLFHIGQGGHQRNHSLTILTRFTSM